MEFGLEIADADGSWILRGSSRPVRFHSFHASAVAQGASKITTTFIVPEMTNDGTWKAYVGGTPAFSSGIEFFYFNGYFEAKGTYYLNGGVLRVVLTRV